MMIHLSYPDLHLKMIEFKDIWCVILSFISKNKRHPYFSSCKIAEKCCTLLNSFYNTWNYEVNSTIIRYLSLSNNLPNNIFIFHSNIRFTKLGFKINLTCIITTIITTPSMAQFVERRTVVESEMVEILRSLVWIRFEGIICIIIFMNESF